MLVERYRKEGPEVSERPPFILRWVWFVGPILVAAAMTGMVLAARSAKNPRRLANATADLEVYAEKDGHSFRVVRGSRLHARTVKLVVVPAGASHALVLRGPEVLAVLGPFAETDVRVNVAPVQLRPGPLHLDLVLSSQALAPATVQIALARDRGAGLAATLVSFDAEVD